MAEKSSRSLSSRWAHVSEAVHHPDVLSPAQRTTALTVIAAMKPDPLKRSNSAASPVHRTSCSPTSASRVSFLRKPRNLAACAVFGAVLARAVWHQVQERVLVADLLATFDVGQDQILTTGELSSLLSANGMDVSQEQVAKIFGRVDANGDGFDNTELERVINIVADLPAISERIRKASDASQALMVDVLLCVIAAVGLAYLVGQTDEFEKKWLQSSFRGAVKFHQMQVKCGKLDKQLQSLSKERADVEATIQALESKPSCSDDPVARQKELRRLGTRLQEVQSQQESMTKQLESEVGRWRQEAEKSMKEANQAKIKMSRMMSCIKGLDAFSGTGTNMFKEEGAQQGFSSVTKSIGFSTDSITFGTIENGHLLLFETSSSRKLGEGRDCAYRCQDLESGRELALKMYKITNPDQRRAIFHDLYAQRSQVGKHERIVSYERVIESENTIFVLMELLNGKDLFDVICTEALTEEKARVLFRQLLEGVQHLHRKQVIHCDIKPENAMLLGSLEDGTANLKLIDFGCSCFKEFEADSRGCVVYDSYMPPEHVADSKLSPSVPTDMWRLGCTLYIMLVQRPPFHNDAQTQAGLAARQAGQLFRVPEYEALSPEARGLIEQLICGDPSKRPTCDEALNHPWLGLA